MTREILIKDMAKKAGEAITRISPSPAQRLTKEGRNNYVTMADKTSEQIIFSMIREYFPYDQVFSEETTSSIDLATVETIEHLWIIDPIDGTVNYQYDRKYSAISIAYAHYGMVTCGIVYDPYRNEEFFAIRGGGSTRNGVNISVSATTDIHDFTLITDNAYDPALIRKHLETVLK
ncbi:MAG: hypothetical protein N3A54_06945, partial [Patescibacteria group bacterium]|nr:hypothetical protein [Patescibacteria group bacterium]